MHCGYVVEVRELRKHTNADRLQIATFFGNDTVVSLDTQVGDIGIYFPSDLQLSKEYCDVNNLVRKKDKNGKEIGGYLDHDKRNIKAIKLRGEKSDGIFMPVTSLDYCFASAMEVVEGKPWIVKDGLPASDYLNVGDTVTVVNGHEICCKYIPRTQHRVGSVSSGNKTRKHRVPYAPLFSEHVDTEQLAYNLGAFKAGDQIEITLKMHGTSQRTAYLPTLHGYKRTFWEKLTRKEGTPIYNWSGVSGTRRVVLEDFDGGFYGSNAFREQHAKFFEGKLWKGETVYYEVVGFTDNGAPIMAECSNKKLNDPDFVKQYGDTTVFSYGCEPAVLTLDDTDGRDQRVVGQSDIYVYRMTMTNEDGDVVEYTPDFMRYRCEQLGVKTVPVMWRGTIPEDLQTEDFFADENGEFEDWVYASTAGEWIKNKAEQYYDGPDPVGKTHIREGVVVRIINRPKFCAYKHKNWSFKALEGIVKDIADAPDMEESQEITQEELT